MNFKFKKIRIIDCPFQIGDIFYQLEYENDHLKGHLYQIRRIHSRTKELISDHSPWKYAIFSYHSNTATDELHIRRATDGEILEYYQKYAKTARFLNNT